VRNSPSFSPDMDIECRGEDAAGVKGAVSLVDMGWNGASGLCSTG
jgi:hypothetical protein